jgi:hypothetical protein
VIDILRDFCRASAVLQLMAEKESLINTYSEQSKSECLKREELSHECKRLEVSLLGDSLQSSLNCDIVGDVR